MDNPAPTLTGERHKNGEDDYHMPGWPSQVQGAGLEIERQAILSPQGGPSSNPGGGAIEFYSMFLGLVLEIVLIPVGVGLWGRLGGGF